MTEDDVEDAFAQLALAFRCDQYTLKRRLLAEEHDRSVAEENLHLELGRSKDTLQSLKLRCQDAARREILERLELSLETMGDMLESIVNAAEQLGAVHQEARVSHSVELMVAHVENLKRRHAKESSELEETRKLVQRSRGRLCSDSTDDGETRHGILRQSSQQYLTRRRVSITLIPMPAQGGEVESKYIDSIKTNGDNDSLGPPEGSTIQPDGSQHVASKEALSRPSAPQAPAEVVSLPQAGHPVHRQEEGPTTLYLNSPVQDTVRHRRRSRAGVREDSEADKDSGADSERQYSDSDDFAPDSHMTEQHPLASWMSQCYWITVWLLVMALSILVFLVVLLWRLRAPVVWL
ncbi:inositol 1,4,5-triphosphate receptor associated 1-like [Megalops cyprinoides]|uniref:inositol 1,4,5-triphosphate receptor associated 1-like n=1 Tax=Megalops cyprinoides TaxID=118141 RepID=UPI0018643BDC|nr:inositol 1,4,5-triphosphate receptor associated 1-like [Megalops cyprinoides]